MKILLCTQYFGECKPVAIPRIAFPLGLAYIGSMLNDHELFVFDANVVNNPLECLRKTLQDVNPDVVAISLRNIDGQLSCNVCSYFEPFLSMINVIKSTSPSSKLIVGGTGFTVFPEEIMKRVPAIDFGIVSNGELAIVELLKNFNHPERVKNVVFRKGDRICFTGLGMSPEVNSLPSPAWDLFDLSTYRKYPFSVGIESKRGCVFNCIHCLYPCLQGRKVLVMSPKKVVNEIETLVNDHGIENFFFVDPIFNHPLDQGQKICQELVTRKLDIKWRAWFRSDRMTSSFITEARDSGCDIFDFSPDGASNESMKVLGKHMNFSDVERTLKLLSKTDDVKVGYNFMYDLPSANLQQIFGLTRFVPKIMRACGKKLQYLGLTRIRIYPNTPIYNIALKNGQITKQTDLIPPVYYKSSSSKIQQYYTSFLAWLVWNQTQQPQ